MALVDFLQAFYEKLDTLADRVYHGDKIDPDAKLPYTYYGYANTDDVETLEDFFMEVDIMDNNYDPTRIEGIVDAIDGDGNIASPSGLNYWNYSSGSTTFQCYRIGRLQIPMNDKKLLRRQLRYRCRVSI